MNAPASLPFASRTIGAILVDSGKLSPADAERILWQQKENNLRFGDAALLLGLVGKDDIAQALARQYNYPYLLKGEGKVAAELVAAYEPFSPQVEALRALRSQLMLRWFASEGGGKALAVCSAVRGEGRSHLAANLAVVFSQLGESTLLIDADLRHPRQHALFGVDDKQGLSSILSGRCGFEAMVRIEDFVNLTLLPAGPLPPNPQELLAQPAFAHLLEAATERHDVVIIDTPAAETYADATLVGARARASLVVARRHKSGLGNTRRLAERLAQSGARPVGTVLAAF